MSTSKSIHPTGMFEALARNSPDGMFALDLEERYVFWNPSMETLSGLRDVQVLGRPACDLFPWLQGSSEHGAMREALAGHARVCSSQSLVLPAGNECRYEAHYYPLHSPQGELLGAMAVIREASDHEAIERRIVETESRFKIMADASPVLLWMSRSDGLCTFFNQTWLDFTGRSMEEEWGVGWAEGVYFEDFQRCMDTYIEAFGARRLFEMEYRLRRRDGEFRWLLDRGVPRYLADGTFAGYIGSCVDITEHKRLEVELREAVRARDEFISVASHELRTPIATLQLQLEMILRNVDRAAQVPPDLGKLSQRVGRAFDKTLYLTSMVETLLDASRIAEEHLQLDRDEVDLAELLREVVERLRDAAAQAGSTLELCLEAHPVGRWDPFRISQVVTNLLSNALKYGEGKPVRVLVSTDSGNARIDVIDQGPGIPPERRPQLFTRFTRLPSPRRQGGFGLGLWIAREVVRAHGGDIALLSAEGGGAHFVVKLPTLAREASKMSIERRPL